jgi:DNA-binding response OmpR family regulator
MNAVLLVETESESRAYLQRHLSDDGFHVIEAGWSSQALDLAERNAPDVVVAAEPDLCRRLREGEPGRKWDRNVPVIVLTDAGVDRHLYLELVARIRALLRRATAGQADVIDVGELTIDMRSRQVRVGSTSVRLSAREFALVARLATDPDRVFTKAELLQDIWGIRDPFVRTRTIDAHVCRARQKLAAAGAPDVIDNVWGVGYQLRRGRL